MPEASTYQFIAEQAYKKSSSIHLFSFEIPLPSRDLPSETAINNYTIDIDLERCQVLRKRDKSEEVIALINQGYKGSSLTSFLGTIEAPDFTITKRKNHWASQDRIYEIVTKANISTNEPASDPIYSNLILTNDTFSDYTFSIIATVKLTLTPSNHLTVAASYTEGHQDITEILASLIHCHHRYFET